MKLAPRICILFFIALAFSFTTASAQFWQQMNGPEGGNINSLTRTPSGHLFAARMGDPYFFGGIFKSIDNGSHWAEADQGITGNLVGSYNALKADSFGNIYLVTGTGIYRSQDDGSHWSVITNDIISQSYFWLLINSKNGFLFTLCDGGLYRSEDHGSNWSLVTANSHYLDNYGAIDSSGTIFIQRGVNLGIATQGVIDESTDNGNAWHIAGTMPLPAITEPSWIEISRSGAMFAYVYDPNIIIRSTDDGKNWTTVASNITGYDIYPMYSATNGILYVGVSGAVDNEHVIYTSGDQGTSWQPSILGFENLPYLEANIFSENNQGEIIVGLNDGIYKSATGSTWTSSESGLYLSSVSSVTEAPNGDIYCGTDFGKIYRSQDDGKTWNLKSSGISGQPTLRNFFTLGPKVVSEDVVQPQIAAAPNGHLFALGGKNSGYTFRSIDNGDHWVAVDSSYPSVLCVDHSGRIFTAGAPVVRSTDDGNNWQKLSAAGLDDIAVTAIAVDDNDNIYVGGKTFDLTTFSYNGGAIYFSSDHGDSWNLRSSGISTFFISSLAISPSGDVYAGTDSGGIFKSTDKGSHWTSALSYKDTSILSMTVHPKGDIFVATAVRNQIGSAGGLLRSTDNGLTWLNFSTGLPDLKSNLISNVFATSKGYVFAGLGYGIGGGIYRGFEATSGVSNSTIPAEDLSIRPIYSQGELHFMEFSIPESANLTLQMFDETGKFIQDVASGYFDGGIHSVEINTKDLSSGVYMIKLSAIGKVETEKIILTK